MRALIVGVIAGSVSLSAIGAAGAAGNRPYANALLVAAAERNQTTEERAAYERPYSQPGNDFGPGFDSVAPSTAGKSA
jgi:hypothetical protein